MRRGFRLFRGVERFGVLVSGGVGKFKVQEVRAFKGVGSWFWCQSGPFFSSGELRSTKACALSCVVFVRVVSVSASFPAL